MRVLIIDDCSPDDTAYIGAELVREDPRVEFIRHVNNKGHIATYNEGIEWAASDYMLLLSADDYLLPGALQRATDLLWNSPEVGFVFGKAFRLYQEEVASVSSLVPNPVPKTRILTGLQFIRRAGACNIVSTPTAVVRTALQKRLGGYRAELPHSGDLEMWLRFAAHAPVGMLDSYQAVYRRHARNMSLAYMAESWLPDLEQRKAALRIVLRMLWNILPNRDQLRRELFWSFGCNALGCASSAFNQGNTEASERIVQFALEACPQIRHSYAWFKLSCKRQLGPELSRVLRSIALTRRRIRRDHAIDTVR